MNLNQTAHQGHKRVIAANHATTRWLSATVMLFLLASICVPVEAGKPPPKTQPKSSSSSSSSKPKLPSNKSPSNKSDDNDSDATGAKARARPKTSDADDPDATSGSGKPRKKGASDSSEDSDDPAIKKGGRRPGDTDSDVDDPANPKRPIRPNAMAFAPEQQAIVPSRSARRKARDSYRAAKDALAINNLEKAIEDFQNAYRNDAHPILAYRLAKVLNQAGRVEECLDVLDAVRTNPRMTDQDVQKFLKLHTVVLNGGDDPDVIEKAEAWRGIRSSNPAYDTVVLKQSTDDDESDIYLEDDPVLVVKQQAKALPRAPAPNYDGDYEDPDSALTVTSDSDASAVVPQVVWNSVKKGANLYLKADAAQKSGDFNTAAKIAKEAYLSDPVPDYAMIAGDNLRKAGRLQEAITWYTEVFGNGTSHIRQQASANARINEIEQQLSAKLKLAPDINAASPDTDFSDFTAQAKLWLDQTKYKPRVGAALRAAWYLEQSGDHERAVSMYRKVVELGENIDADQSVDQTDPENKPQVVAALVARAKSALKQARVTPVAKYGDTRAPLTKYVGDTGTDLYAEEDTPVENPFTNMSIVVRDLIDGKRNVAFVRGFIGKMTGISNDQQLNDFIVELGVKVAEQDSKNPNLLSPLKMADIDSGLRKNGIMPQKNPPLPDSPDAFKTPQSEQFQKRKVKYLKSTAERAPFELRDFESNGEVKIFRGIPNLPGTPNAGGGPLDTAEMSTAFSGKGWGIFVMSPDGKMYVGNHEVGQFHHSSFLAASDVAGAGELQATDGKITTISNKSGHYHPRAVHLVQTLEELGPDGIGLNLKGIKVQIVAKFAGNVAPQPWEDATDPSAPNDAESFLNLFRNDKAAFIKHWKSRGFENDPFEGTADEGVYFKDI